MIVERLSKIKDQLIKRSSEESQLPKFMITTEWSKKNKVFKDSRNNEQNTIAVIFEDPLSPINLPKNVIIRKFNRGKKINKEKIETISVLIVKFKCGYGT